MPAHPILPPSPPWPTNGPLGSLAALRHWQWETFTPEPWTDGLPAPALDTSPFGPQQASLGSPQGPGARAAKAWPYWALPLGGVLFIHSLGLVLLGLFSTTVHTPIILAQKAAPTPLASHWELAFLSINPDAPSHVPDKARYVSTADQQASQPQLGPLALPVGPDPTVTGTEPHSQAITQATGPTPSTAAATATHAAPTLLPDTLPPAASPVHLTLSPSSTAHEATPLAPAMPQLSPARRPPAYPQATLPSRYPDPPMPRPTLAGYKEASVPAPLRKTHSRVARQGVVAADTALSPFGLYTADLLAAIATQWHILGRTHQASLPSTRAQVRIAFELDAQGHVTGLRVQASCGHPLADLLCQDAIASRSPFGPWSPEMVTQLGKVQTVQIHFFYE